jgi:hypothetical protein
MVRIRGWCGLGQVGGIVEKAAQTFLMVEIRRDEPVAASGTSIEFMGTTHLCVMAETAKLNSKLRTDD